MAENDVRLERVTKRFADVVAVDDLTLDIARGEFFSLLGPSGCGKTTTLRMIGGFEDPTEGAIYLGLAAYFAGMGGGALQRWLILATLAALAGSFLVSYVRARAQSLGFTCESGIFARPERVVVMVIGLILGGWVLYAVVFLLALLTNLTALQRIREVWLQGRAQRLERQREAAARATTTASAQRLP